MPRPQDVKKWWLNGKKAPAELTAALMDLERDVGLLKTQEQFEKAMDWRELGKTGEEDIFRDKVWKAYNETQNYLHDGFLSRVADQYSLFELFGQFPQYFLADVEIDDDYSAELACLGRMYMGVAGRNALDLLDDPFEGESIAESGGTCAEKFRAYLERFRGKNNFEEWTIDLLQSTRPAIFKALRGPLPRPGRAVNPAGHATGSSSRSAPRSQATNGAGGSDGHAEETPEPLISNESGLQRTNGSHHSRSQSEELSEDIEDELASLRGLLGNIKDCAEIRRASKIDAIHNEIPASIRTKAFKVYTNSESNNINEQRMHWELHFYRLTGETAASMIDTDNEAQDLEDLQLRHLLYLAQRWTSLSATDDLGELGETEAVRSAMDEGRSVGQIIKAYLADYQQQNGIAEWSGKNISDARQKVVEVWNKVQIQRREKGKRPASAVAESRSATKRARRSRGESSATAAVRNGSVATSSRNQEIKTRRTGSVESNLY